MFRDGKGIVSNVVSFSCMYDQKHGKEQGFGTLERNSDGASWARRLKSPLHRCHAENNCLHMVLIDRVMFTLSSTSLSAFTQR
jgi:hypothetical protein